MPRIHPVHQENAETATAELLGSVQKKLGKVPNLTATMANSPAVAKAYLGFSQSLSSSFNALDRVRLLRCKIEQLTGLKFLGLARRSESNLAFQALNDDFAGSFMLGDFLASWHDNADDFYVFGLKQCFRFRVGQCRSQRSNIDDLAGLCVWDCHLIAPSSRVE